jgi:hypothetical protein
LKAWTAISPQAQQAPHVAFAYFNFLTTHLGFEAPRTTTNPRKPDAYVKGLIKNGNGPSGQRQRFFEIVICRATTASGPLQSAFLPPLAAVGPHRTQGRNRQASVRTGIRLRRIQTRPYIQTWNRSP